MEPCNVLNIEGSVGDGGKKTQLRSKHRTFEIISSTNNSCNKNKGRGEMKRRDKVPTLDPEMSSLSDSLNGSANLIRKVGET